MEMNDESIHEMILRMVDDLLELPPQKVNSAKKLWSKIEDVLKNLSKATEIDDTVHNRFTNLLNSLTTQATKFLQSLGLSRASPLRDDWTRLAQLDLTKLKDELLELKEFLTTETDFLKLIRLRSKLKHLGATDPEKLFEELYHAKAISERTWILLMTQSNVWKRSLKDNEVFEGLSRVSEWFFDLEEVRRSKSDL
jgi:hypothetical protein